MAAISLMRPNSIPLWSLFFGSEYLQHADTERGHIKLRYHVNFSLADLNLHFPISIPHYYRLKIAPKLVDAFETAEGDRATHLVTIFLRIICLFKYSCAIYQRTFETVISISDEMLPELKIRKNDSPIRF